MRSFIDLRDSWQQKLLTTNSQDMKRAEHQKGGSRLHMAQNILTSLNLLWLNHQVTDTLEQVVWVLWIFLMHSDSLLGQLYLS